MILNKQWRSLNCEYDIAASSFPIANLSALIALGKGKTMQFSLTLIMQKPKTNATWSACSSKLWPMVEMESVTETESEPLCLQHVGEDSALINPFTTETYQNTSLTFPIKITPLHDANDDTTKKNTHTQAHIHSRTSWEPQKAQGMCQLLTTAGVGPRAHRTDFVSWLKMQQKLAH